MTPIIGIGKYRREDYKEILSISDDTESMDTSWKDWKRNKEKAKTDLIKEGFDVVDVIVIPRELVDYCRRNGLKINGSSRSQYVTNKLRELNT